jgi:hypothetical protein
MNPLNVCIELVNTAEFLDSVADEAIRTGHSGPAIPELRRQAIACTHAALWLVCSTVEPCQVPSTGDKDTARRNAG